MTRNLFLTTAAIAALSAGAFAQTQTQEQQPAQAGQQQPAAQGEAVQGQAAEPAQQPAQVQVEVVDPAQQQMAAGECAARMEQVSGGDFFVGENAGYRQHLPVLTDLRDSAMQLQAQNLDEACLRVVEAMEIAIQTYADTDPQAGLATRGEFTREQLEARLVPVDANEMPINTARLQGTDLYNYDGEDIGDVEGFLVAQGSPTHMIVSHGGFWDIGDSDIAIPLDIVRWDPEWQTFFAPLTDEQMDQAPEYDESAWDGQANDPFYDAVRG